MKNKLRVGILFGGKSAEHEISCDSAQSVFGALDKTKCEPVLIKISREGDFFLVPNSFFDEGAQGAKARGLFLPEKSLLLAPKGASEQFISKDGDKLPKLDVVFPVLHGPFGEDGTVQGLLKIANIPFVGSCVLSTALCMDKDMTKRLLMGAGLPVCKSLVFRKHEKDEIDFKKIQKELGLPVFIKPCNMGSSVGISQAFEEKSLKKAIEEAFAYDTKVIIDEAIEGREIEVGLLGHGGDVAASSCGEIVTAHDFYSYEAKYADKSLKLDIPADIPEEVSKEMKELAIKAFKALECSGLCRCDFFLEKNGRILINELNSLPGFTGVSMYPKLWENAGVSYSRLIQRLLELALKKHEEINALKVTSG